MSLAMYAAPFENDKNDNDDNNNNAIQKKKMGHKRTQKNYQNQNVNSEKVNSVLQSIHNNSTVEEDDGMGEYGGSGDYVQQYGNPPPNPISVGSERTKPKEGMQNNTLDLGKSLGSLESENTNDLELNNIHKNYGNDSEREEYYKKYIPNFYPSMIKKHIATDHNKMYYEKENMATTGIGMLDNDLLIQKLNYMINLLEERQDERTNNVTEEVVLYSFLGIFIIFIVDSFARVGKYKR